MNKRSNGEGTIYQRSDGRWTAAISLPTVQNGKPRRKQIYGKSQREVREQLIKLRNDQQQGINIAPQRQTVKQYLENWLETVVKPNRRPATYTQYEASVRLHIVPVLGKIQLQKLTAQNVNDFINMKKDEGKLSNRTIQLARSVLHAGLEQAVKWELVHRNVVHVVDAPKVTQIEVQPFTKEELKTFLFAIKRDRLEALWIVSVSLGLRRGEVLGLLWEDIDFEKETLSIKAGLQRVEGKVQRLGTKTKKANVSLCYPKLS